MLNQIRMNLSFSRQFSPPSNRRCRFGEFSRLYLRGNRHQLIDSIILAHTERKQKKYPADKLPGSPSSLIRARPD